MFSDHVKTMLILGLSGPCFHLHTFKRVSLPSSRVSENVPGAPVDAICDASVAAAVVTSIQIGSQTGIKPPACTIVLSTVTSCIAIMIVIIRAESSAVMVVVLTIAESVTSITLVILCSQTKPDR